VYQEEHQELSSGLMLGKRGMGDVAHQKDLDCFAVVLSVSSAPICSRSVKDD